MNATMYQGESTESLDLSEYHPSIPKVVEFHEMAPAPSQTYHQVLVYPWNAREMRPPTAKGVKEVFGNIPERDGLHLDAMKHGKKYTQLGCVVVREWPRRRMSQRWIRGGAVNPTEQVLEFEDALDLSFQRFLVRLFGEERSGILLDTIRGEIQRRDKTIQKA